MKILDYLIKRTRSFSKLAISLPVFCASFAAFADDTLCINPLGSSPPVLNGEIDSDIGWMNASQYSFLNGSSGQHGRVQLSRDPSNIYVSFEIDKLPNFNANTQIILLFGPVAGDPAQDWRIHIFPGSDSGNGANSLPSRIQAWKNSGSWTPQVNCEPALDATCSTPASLVEAKVTAASSGSDNAYRVELRLTVGATGINIPAAATDIKLAFNALRVYKMTTAGIIKTVADQLNWPTVASIPGAVFPAPPGSTPNDANIMANPAPIIWGTAVLPSWGQACTGVRVKSRWINTTATPAELKPPTGGNPVTNKFFVEVENAGTVPAGHVLATIRSARFGSAPNQSYAKIGPPNGTVSPNNPVGSYTSGNQTAIAAGDTRQLVPMEWTLTSAEYQNLYSTGTNVCSVIELDVDPAHVPAGVFRTQIASRYFPWNIHMAPASVFRNAALLDTKGYDAPPVAGDPQRFELQVSTHEVTRLSADELRDIERAKLSRQTHPEYNRTSESGSVSTYDNSNAHVTGAVGKTVTLPSVKDEVINPAQSKFPVIPRLEAQRLLEYVGGMPHYLKGAGFLIKTVCPYRHTGRYLKFDSNNVELMERGTCFEYWIFHIGDIKEWLDELMVSPPFNLIDNGTGFYSIDVPVGASVELNTRIEAIDKLNVDEIALWKWLLLFLIIFLLLFLLIRRKP